MLFNCSCPVYVYVSLFFCGCTNCTLTWIVKSRSDKYFCFFLLLSECVRVCHTYLLYRTQWSTYWPQGRSRPQGRLDNFHIDTYEITTRDLMMIMMMKVTIYEFEGMRESGFRKNGVFCVDCIYIYIFSFKNN